MPVAAGVCTPREQLDIALPLMIALSMIMFDIFAQGPPQRVLTKQNHLGQALLLHRPDPALRISIQVRMSQRARTRPARHRSVAQSFPATCMNHVEHLSRACDVGEVERVTPVLDMVP